MALTSLFRILAVALLHPHRFLYGVLSQSLASLLFLGKFVLWLFPFSFLPTEVDGGSPYIQISPIIYVVIYENEE